MYAITRNAPKRVHFISSRAFAEVIPVNAKNPPTSPPPVADKPTEVAAQEGKVPIREDHGLWHFFRRKADTDLVGEARYETVEHPSKVEQSRTGRAWKASELRLKNFGDLHTLWYVVLRERNLLATQKEEARRMGISDTGLQVSAERVHQCRKTMARIKAVLNERRLAYEGTLKLIEEQKEQAEDELVLQYQREKMEEDCSRILTRRQLTERRREARLRRETEAQQVAVDTEAKSEAQSQTNTIETSNNESTEAPLSSFEVSNAAKSGEGEEGRAER